MTFLNRLKHEVDQERRMTPKMHISMHISVSGTYFPCVLMDVLLFEACTTMSSGRLKMGSKILRAPHPA